MTRRPRVLPFSSGAFGTLLLVTAACGMGSAARPEGDAVGDLGEQPGVEVVTTPDGVDIANATPPIVASTVVNMLEKAGVDARNLPSDIDKLEKDQHNAMMASFKASLGVECTGCHASKTQSDGSERLEPKRATVNKRIAGKMYTEFVQKLRFADGSALYCDSCHQGKAKFLDRSSGPGLRQWMHDNFATKLVQKDGTAVTCTTCHGAPFNGDILEAWGTGSNE